jgi:hypothetical protein
MLFGLVEADNLPEFGGGASAISLKAQTVCAMFRP